MSARRAREQEGDARVEHAVEEDAADREAERGAVEREGADQAPSALPGSGTIAPAWPIV